MISERSIDADSEVFAKLLYQKQFMNETEYQLYQAEFQGFRDILQLKPVDHYIYLRCSPEICLKRLQCRNRLE
jgi:deoxyadenosine/deoxycytidine kinase